MGADVEENPCGTRVFNNWVSPFSCLCGTWVFKTRVPPFSFRSDYSSVCFKQQTYSTPPPPSSNAQAIFLWEIVFFYSNILLNHPKSLCMNKATVYVCDCQGNDKFNSVTHFIKQVANATNLGWYNKRKQLRYSSLRGRVDS